MTKKFILTIKNGDNLRKNFERANQIEADIYHLKEIDFNAKGGFFYKKRLLIAAGGGSNERFVPDWLAEKISVLVKERIAELETELKTLFGDMPLEDVKEEKPTTIKRTIIKEAEVPSGEYCQKADGSIDCKYCSYDIDILAGRALWECSFFNKYLDVPCDNKPINAKRNIRKCKECLARCKEDK